MKRFIEGECRTQAILFPDRLDDWIGEDNPVRAIDVFVDELDFRALDFEGAEPASTGRPAYHPATLLKIYIYGYAFACRTQLADARVPDGFASLTFRIRTGNQGSGSDCLPLFAASEPDVAGAGPAEALAPDGDRLIGGIDI